MELGGGKDYVKAFQSTGVVLWQPLIKPKTELGWSQRTHSCTDPSPWPMEGQPGAACGGMWKDSSAPLCNGYTWQAEGNE